MVLGLNGSPCAQGTVLQPPSSSLLCRTELAQFDVGIMTASENWTSQAVCPGRLWRCTASFPSFLPLSISLRAQPNRWDLRVDVAVAA